VGCRTRRGRRRHPRRRVRPPGFLAAPLAGIVAILLPADGSLPRASLRRRASLGAAFALAAFAVVAVSLTQILVWNPLAKVPGLPLDAIYAEMTAAGQLVVPAGHMILVMWAASSMLGAVGFAAISLRPWQTTPRIAVEGFALVGLIAATQWFASFNMGMALADTFMTDGGDATIVGQAIMWIGQFALATALALSIVHMPRAQNRPAAAV